MPEVVHRGSGNLHDEELPVDDGGAVHEPVLLVPRVDEGVPGVVDARDDLGVAK